MQLLAEQGALERPGFKARSMMLPDVFIDHDTRRRCMRRPGSMPRPSWPRCSTCSDGATHPELHPAEITFLAERARLRRGLALNGAKGMNGGAV